MIKTRRSNFLLLRFFLFIYFPLFAGCQNYSLSNNSSKVIEKFVTNKSNTASCKDKNIGAELAVINNNVQQSKKFAAWPPNYNLLEDKSPFIISTSKELILYTSVNSTEDINQIKKLSEELTKKKLLLICFDKSNSTSYPTAIFLYSKPESDLNVTSYSFVYPTFSPKLYNSQVDLNLISNKIGKYLYIYIPSNNEANLTEMQRTLIHEGTHFFGQSKIINLQPAIPDSEIDPRTYLSTKYQQNSYFRASVNQELCVASSLLEGVFVEPKKSKKHINNLLNQMWIIRSERSNAIGVDIIEVENFWYLVEGIPQFLDQKILVEKNKITTLINYYKVFCEENYISNFPFYPLYAGAAITTGLEYTLGDLALVKANSDFTSEGLLKWGIIIKFDNQF